MHRKLIIPLIGLLFAILFVVARPTYAGGWATVGVTEMPDQPQAEQPFTLSFMVWQHGTKAVHELYWDGKERPITPEITFTSAETGQTVTFTAERGKQQGCFNAEVVLPGEGTWEWSIALEPLQNVTEMQPLTVLPAKSAAARTTPAQTAALFSANISLVAVLAAAVFIALLLTVNRLRVSEQSS